jgi:hypothetical protein
MGVRNRVGIGLSYRPGRLHRLAESIPGLPRQSSFLTSMGSENRFVLHPSIKPNNIGKVKYSVKNCRRYLAESFERLIVNAKAAIVQSPYF